MGLEDGRYLERAGDGGAPQRVLVVSVAGALPPPRRRLGRSKPKQADPEGRQTAVPLTTLTVIRPEPLGDATAAEGWLAGLRDDDVRLAAELEQALQLINRATHAHRVSVLDPNLPDVAGEHALTVRIGFGSGDELVDGRFSDAIEVPHSARRRRGETLRPQERLAAVLAGREEIPACELLVLRARADLDAGRSREAALQLRVALEALLAERNAFSAPGQDADLTALDQRRRATGEAANEALAGELAGERVAELAETLGLGERVLRRKRALG